MRGVWISMAAKKSKAKQPKGNTPESVAIVAMGLSHRDYVLSAAMCGSWHHMADEIWAINAMCGVIQFSRGFCTDNPEGLSRVFQESAPEGRQPIDYNPWATTTDKPIYCVSDVDNTKYPNWVKYPMEEVVNCIGYPYINNTVAYAVAYAIYIGVKEISIFGADFTYPGDKHGSEAGRGCVEFLLAIAMSRGIKVNVAAHSTLLDTNVPMSDKLYGFAHSKDYAKVTMENGQYKVDITRRGETNG